jgi:hypothetical protein
MKAELKSLSCDDHDLDNFYPEDDSLFCITLILRIGKIGTFSADNFELRVCTPKWLEQSIGEMQVGRHLLIVRDFSLPRIRDFVDDLVNDIEGDDWNSVAQKLARYFFWEYEDYVE